jgi:hypothetical protein
LTPTGAVFADIVACYSADSTCNAHASPQTFTLAATSDTLYCVPQINGLNSCTGYADTNFRKFPIYTPNGVTLIGCSENSATQCPPAFPIYFTDPAQNPSIQRCQASIAGTCSSIANGGYPTPLFGEDNAVIGCQTNGATLCGDNQIPLKDTAEGPVRACSSVVTACTNPSYPTALYDSTTDFPEGQPVMCLSATGADCSAAAFASYNVEVYANPGSTSVTGCMKTTSEPATLCPGTTVPFLTQITTGGRILKTLL